MKFVATKKGLTTNFFTPLFCCCFWIRDPKSGIRDPGSGMGKNKDLGSGINIPDLQHCRESPNWIAGPRWRGGGGKLGSQRKRSEGAELKGENNRGGRVEGL